MDVRETASSIAPGLFGFDIALDHRADLEPAQNGKGADTENAEGCSSGEVVLGSAASIHGLILWFAIQGVNLRAPL